MTPDDPAFPVVHEEFPFELMGLTKREWFAGMALQGICAARASDGYREIQALVANKFNLELETTVALLAIEYADALIAELAKEKP